MFIPIDDRPPTTLRPADSAISAPDWLVLSDYWYPIAIVATLGPGPVKARLLDVDLVIYRGAEEDIAVALDLCPHRHVRLSGGRVIEGEIQCPFHGLRFDTTGQCRRVPALGADVKLPASYRVQTFPTRQLYGLLWTCLGDASRHTVPHLPALAEVPASELTFAEPLIWPVSAPRQVENFFDLAHLPLVHAATLGGDLNRAVKPGRIEHTADAVILYANFIETRPDGSAKPCTYRYRVVLPFIVDFTATDDADPEHALRSSDLATPISAYESLVFQVHRVTGGPSAGQGLLQALAAVNNEDIAVLKGLVRRDLPLDHRHEIHIAVDNMANEYRSRLRALGLGRRPQP